MSSSSSSSSSSEDGNGGGNGSGAVGGYYGARRGGDFEGPPPARRRAVNEVWPEPFVEALAAQVAIDAARSDGRLAAAAALANVFQVRSCSFSSHKMENETCFWLILEEESGFLRILR